MGGPKADRPQDEHAIFDDRTGIPCGGEAPAADLRTT
jgi:hypothetical protein